MRRAERPMILGIAILLAAILTLFVFTQEEEGAAAAPRSILAPDTPGVVLVDSGDITLETKDKDKPEGKVTLVNLRDSPVMLKAYVKNREFDPEPSSLEPGSPVQVILPLQPDEVSAGAASVTIAYWLAGTNIGSDVVVVKLVTASPADDWKWLLILFIAAAGLSGILVYAVHKRTKDKLAYQHKSARGIVQIEHPERAAEPIGPPGQAAEPIGPPGQAAEPTDKPREWTVTLKNQNRYALGVAHSFVTGDKKCEVTVHPDSLEPRTPKGQEVTIRVDEHCDIGHEFDVVLKWRNSPGDAELQGVVEDELVLRMGKPRKINYQTKLDGLGTDWSFKDNWVSSFYTWRGCAGRGTRRIWTP